MEQLLSDNDPTTVSLLILFILGLLTKRFVPWWVHEDAIRRLRVYEEAAPELITEVRRLMVLLDEANKDKKHITANPKSKRRAPSKSNRTGNHD